MPPKSYYLDTYEPVDSATLLALGVETWRFPVDYENDANFNALCEQRGYTFKDFVDSSKMPNLAEKLNTFKIEHLHEDDEIRFFLGGSGYFDVRNGLDPTERLIRIHGFAGDMITLPAGIYHRFMPDEKLNFFVMRLFQGAPVWTAFNRDEPTTDLKSQRRAYVSKYLSGGLDDSIEVELSLANGSTAIENIKNASTIVGKLTGSVVKEPVFKNVKVEVEVTQLEAASCTKRIPVNSVRAQFAEKATLVRADSTVLQPRTATRKRKGFYTEGPNGTLVEIDDDIVDYTPLIQAVSVEAKTVDVSLVASSATEVVIPTHRVEKKKGFRVDSVLDWEIVQYKNQIEYELRPVRVVKSEKIVLGRAQAAESKSPYSLLNRTLGSEFFEDEDPNVSGLPLDVSMSKEPIHG